MLFHRLLNACYRFVASHSGILSLIAVVLVFIGVLMLRMKLVYTHFGDISGVESTTVVYFIQMLLADLPIYTDPEVPPFSITPYTPLYYYLCTAVGKIFGVNPDVPIEVFILGRWVSLVLNFLTCGVFLITMRQVFKASWVWSAVFMFIVFIFLEHQVYNRIDSLILFFFSLVVYFFLRYLNSDTRRRQLIYLFLAVFSAILYLFTKQSGIYLPIAMGAYLVLFAPKRIDVLWFVGFYTVCLVITGFILIDDMGLFSKNAMKSLNNSIDFKWFFQEIAYNYLSRISVFIIAALALSFYFLEFTRNTTYRFLALVMAATFSFALLTSLKDGSGPNYFGDFIFAITLSLGGAFFSRNHLLKLPLQALKTKGFLFLCAILVVVPMKGLISIWDYNYDDSITQYQESEAITAFIKNDLDLKNDEWVFIYLDRLADLSILNNFLFRNSLLPNKDAYAYTRATNAYNMAGFEQGMVNGMAKYLILPHNAQSIPFLGFEVKFRLVKAFPSYSVYEWCPEPCPAAS